MLNVVQHVSIPYKIQIENIFKLFTSLVEVYFLEHDI